jgi:hypothetical protein
MICERVLGGGPIVLAIMRSSLRFDVVLRRYANAQMITNANSSLKCPELSILASAKDRMAIAYSVSVGVQSIGQIVRHRTNAASLRNVVWLRAT